MWKLWAGGYLEVDGRWWACVGSSWSLNPTLLPGHLWLHSLLLWYSISTPEPNTREPAADELIPLKSVAKVIPLNCLIYLLQQQNPSNRSMNHPAQLFMCVPEVEHGPSCSHSKDSTNWVILQTIKPFSNIPLGKWNSKLLGDKIS